MKNIFFAALFLATALLLGACSERGGSDNDAMGMKCGAGKCGANMISGHSALAQKQRTILSQMHKDDPRRGCVLNAPDVAALYDCVRDAKTKRLSAKCGNDTNAMNEGMKCGTGKCGAEMKCGAGKCGG